MYFRRLIYIATLAILMYEGFVYSNEIKITEQPNSIGEFQLLVNDQLDALFF
jgi:hypothetical protein